MHDERPSVRTLDREQVRLAQTTLRRVRDEVEKVIVGKRDVVERVIVAILSEGHVLLDDVPGTGKTRLARTLTRSLGGAFRRIQFTPDLLPGDVTGSLVFDQPAQRFVFHPGPVFANVVLADEISPDNCRLWDAKTGEKMDKDRFRRDLGKVEEGYQEVARRLGILPEAGPRDMTGPEVMQ